MIHATFRDMVENDWLPIRLTRGIEVGDMVKDMLWVDLDAGREFSVEATRGGLSGPTFYVSWPSNSALPEVAATMRAVAGGPLQIRDAYALRDDMELVGEEPFPEDLFDGRKPGQCTYFAAAVRASPRTVLEWSPPESPRGGGHVALYGITYDRAELRSLMMSTGTGPVRDNVEQLLDFFQVHAGHFCRPGPLLPCAGRDQSNGLGDDRSAGAKLAGVPKEATPALGVHLRESRRAAGGSAKLS